MSAASGVSAWAVLALTLAGCADAPSSSRDASPVAASPSGEVDAGRPGPVPSVAAAAPSASAAAPAVQRRAPSFRVRKVDAGARGDAAALKAAIEARGPGVLACYAEARRVDRTLMGRVSASFTWTATGAAEKVKTGGDLPESMQTCVARELAAAALPKPPEDTPSSFVVELEPGRVHLLVNGKPWYDATGADIEASLRALGCVGFKDESPKKMARQYTATLDGKHLHVTFTPKTSTANPGAFHFAPKQIAELRRRAAVFQATDFVLAIRIEEDADISGAAALLDRIVTEI